MLIIISFIVSPINRIYLIACRRYLFQPIAIALGVVNAGFVLYNWISIPVQLLYIFYLHVRRGEHPLTPSHLPTGQRLALPWSSLHQAREPLVLSYGTIRFFRCPTCRDRMRVNVVDDAPQIGQEGAAALGKRRVKCLIAVPPCSPKDCSETACTTNT